MEYIKTHFDRILFAVLGAFVISVIFFGFHFFSLRSLVLEHEAKIRDLEKNFGAYVIQVVNNAVSAGQQ